MNEMVENKGCLKGYIGGRKLRLASLLSIISTAISAILFMALPASAASFSQQDLFKRAFSSTAYIMTMAERDPGFMASLSANEKLMLKKVTIVAQRARNFEWLKQNGVYISPEGRSYTVVKKYDYQRSFEESEYEEAFVIETRVRAELAFSSDQSLFDLKPGEAIRTAVTGDDPHAPIFVNTEIINSPKNRIGFSEAVQLLIHEFGHKLVKEKLQNEVDTLAAKVKSFIDSKMTTSRISNGQVHALRFETSFYPEWQENAIQGTYVGVNIPPRFDEFRAVSGEGIYVFLENESGTVDISTGLHNDIIKASTFNPYAGLAYDWRHMRFFTSRAIRVRETEAGKVRIEMEMEQAQTALPFLKPGVPDPRAYRPWRQIMSKSELGQYNNHRIEWTIDTKSTVPVIETSWEKAMVFEDASIAAKLVSTKMTGNDLVFEFEIPEQIEVAGTGVTKTRDFLILSYGSQVFEIEGLRNQTKKNSVTFNLRGAGLRMAGEIKPLNIEVEPLTRNLARHYYVRTRIFMDRSEAVKLTGATPTAPIVLNDLEVLGENLKFVFDSSTELSTLKIGIRIQTSKLTVSTVHSQGEPSKEMGRGTMALPVHDTILTLGPEDLVQKFENGKLVVTTKLGRNTVAKLYAETDITPPDLPGWGKKIRMIEETWTEVSPARELLRIEAVNESGVMLRKFLDKPVKYGP